MQLTHTPQCLDYIPVLEKYLNRSMEKENKHKRTVKVALFLGVAEGILWFILSLSCLILHFINFPSKYKDYYLENVAYQWYFIFLRGETDRTEHPLFLSTKAFSGLIIWLLVLSSAWIYCSFYTLANYKSPRILALWGHITLLVSFWDLIIVVLLGLDYCSCIDLDENPYANEKNFCFKLIFPVLALFARGFIFWILNVTLATYFIILRRKTEENGVHQNNNNYLSLEN